MATATIQEEFTKIKEKFSDLSESELKKALKEVCKKPKLTRKEIMDEVSSKLKDIVTAYDKVPLATLKKELVEVWKSVHPDGIVKTPRAQSEWHIFMKENGPMVQQQHPNSTQRDRIKILGVLYNNAKAAKEAAAAPAPEATPAAAPAPAKIKNKK